MEFPKSYKPLVADTKQDQDRLWRFLSLRNHAVLEWRHRPYMLGESVDYTPTSEQVAFYNV